MVKIKTRSAAKKRFKRVANGKVKRAKAFHRHLLTSKSSKRKRGLRKSAYINASDMGRVRKMLPYT